VRLWIAVLVLAAAIVLSAGPAAADAKASTFLGRVHGSDAYIAILKDGRKIGGYVCNNGTVSRWLEYTWLRDGRAPLIAGTTGERVGRVRIADKDATGTIEVNGHKRTFRAGRTREKDGGLHFAVGKQPDRLLVAGWILLRDGTQRGAISGVDMQTVQALAPTRAPRLKPNARTVEIGGGTNVPPVETEPQQLVVINIIAILIGLLLPAVQ
jgi:hypothetical protein